MVLGDFNMGVDVMMSLNHNPGVATLTRMLSYDLGFTWQRSEGSDTRSHPDQVFSSFPLRNVRKIK